MHEIDDKVDRLARLAASRGLGGILLNTQPNFAWLTGGRSNQIDGSRETGSGCLLVSASGERYVVANNIEMPRLQEEALAGLGFTPHEYPWTLEQEDSGTVVAAARRAAAGEVGCDVALTGGVLLDGAIAATRALLTPEEVERYRALGRDLGNVIGEVGRAIVPNLTESDIAQRVAAAVSCIGARAIVNLVAADDRIARYRHPAPTATAWQRQVMIVVCAQRHGLVAALSRIIVNGAIPADLDRRTAATASVFAALIDATHAGATGANLFGAAARAYAAAGFPAEETRHHQGGATGYRSREWLAHPSSRETVQRRQAFAWNPSITGTKVEETMLVTERGYELITTSPGWPAIPVAVNGSTVHAAAILSL